MAFGIYSPEGYINVTVVDGLSRVNRYAANGSWNVVVATGTAWKGANHPCGALWVTVAPSTGAPARAPDGSLYVTESGAFGRGTRVKVVSGSLSGGGAAYTYRGSVIDPGNGSDTISGPVDIGTAAANRLIIVGTGIQNAHDLTNVTVNGVSLTRDVQSVGQFVAIASGVVALGSGVVTVSATWTGSGFNERLLQVWAATGLGSTTVRTTAASNTNIATISVTNTDFMFAVSERASAATTDFNASTVAPNNNRQAIGIGHNLLGGDWIILATNAAFSVQTSSGAGIQGTAAATYR